MEASDFGKLIRGITSNVNNYISEKIEPYGIKQGQFEYFLLIFMSPGINQLELGKLKHVGKASVTKALKILEEDGFIKRVNDSNDKRNTLCYVSEKGEKIAEHLIKIREIAETEMFIGFTESERVELFNYLKKLMKNSEGLLEREE